MIDKKSVTENFLTRNIVADVKQISNNSGMKYTKKHGRNPNISGGEIILARCETLREPQNEPAQ